MVDIVRGLGLNPEITQLFENLMQVWIHNCLLVFFVLFNGSFFSEYSDDPQGFATHFLPSFMSHSCAPTCVWGYQDKTQFVLRARRPMTDGE